MFVVEPGSGKSRGYATARELGAAIRRGELGPQARIYHRATDRWLPITVHPEYRRAAAEREQLSARELQQRQWTFLADPHAAERLRAMADAGHEGPVLIPGDPSRSWFGTTVRRLMSLAHL